MGGGDLNLKKSWHPSTLRNIERVWKAEQKHEAEIQKIEQLQKELADERAREEIQTFAEDQGVVRKKEEKLDWMYQGPAAMVNRDEFLLGRKIDNTFEKMQLIESGKVPEDETADVGSTLFSSQNLSGTATVDLATKIREDPLFNIMKKEKEQRKNLLTNPVKMKQLQQMLKASLTEKSKKKNKKSKKKKHQESDSEEEEKPHKRKKQSKHRSSSSDEERTHLKESRKYFRTKTQKEHHPDDEELIREKRRNRSRSPYRNGESNHYSSKYSRNDSYDQDAHRERTHKSYAKHKHVDRVYERRDYSPKQRRHSPPQYKDKSNGYKRNRSESSSPQRKPSKSETERLLKEMQENAKWREKQRKKNTERYKKEDEREDDIKRIDASDFMKPMLSKAAGKGSLENRVKQKIFSIQRSSAAMDKHFARRE